MYVVFFSFVICDFVYTEIFSINLIIFCNFSIGLSSLMFSNINIISGKTNIVIMYSFNVLDIFNPNTK